MSKPQRELFIVLLFIAATLAACAAWLLWTSTEISGIGAW